jgi:hypothetical protein
MDHMDMVEEPVEDRGGEDLVPGEHLGPVAHVLVRRHDDRALLVPRRHEAEEQVGFVSCQRAEADLVD